jgi:beta-ribofuranosylaminobenzene 5'-phosphate synthase
MCITVEAAASVGLSVDLGDPDLEIREKTTDAIARARDRGLPLTGRFTLVDRFPSHVGLGSTTATTMTLLQAIAAVNGWSISRAELIALSGRGRTSAIGCHTFFEGGLLVDAGQRGHPTGSYVPSMLPAGRRPSLRLGRWPMPTDWHGYLLFAFEPPSVPPADEAAFFSSAAPTGRTDTLHQLAHLYHGILPAIVEADLTRLARSLREFQSCGLKAREIAAQSEKVRSTLARLWADGFAAGLSSLGPTIFVIVQASTTDLVPALSGDIPVLGPLRFRNQGFEISPGDGPTTDRRAK